MMPIKRIAKTITFKDHPKEYTGPDFFNIIKYRDTGVRANHSDSIVSTECIILNIVSSGYYILDLNSSECLPEYKEKFKEWDKQTLLPYWSAKNDIPYQRFLRKIMKTQIHTVIGKIYYIVKDVKPTRISRRAMKGKSTNKVYQWE